jgi:cyclase
MRNIRLIARLDIKSSNLIKGVQLEGLRVVGNPHEYANKYFNEGIDEIIYMDTVASLYGRNSLRDIILETSKNIFVPITVGGGIRTLEDAYQILRSGADKISINTAAINNPKILKDLVNRFGSSTIVLSIEAKKTQYGWEAYTNNGREKTGINVVDWAIEGEKLGVGEILLTSVDQEGTCRGFDYDLIKSITDKINIPVIASGGMGSLDHFEKVINYSKCDAISIANMLHYNKITIKNIREFGKKKKINLRI